MNFKRFLLGLFLVASQLTLISPSAQAGGGCGSSNPRISTDLVKPGQTFDVTTEYQLFDADPNQYLDPNYVPLVTFSKSISWLTQTSQFLGSDANGGRYKATFKVPDDFKGNMQLQAIVFNICGSTGNQGTFGPRVLIQSDSSLPTCQIDSVKVSDYSVDVGENYKIAFTVYSAAESIEPFVELTEYSQVTKFPARLVGTSSSSSTRVFEATLNYSQARQYDYGAIARPEVPGLCNAAGVRDLIGIYGYVSSKAMLKPIIKSAECSAGNQPVVSIDYLGRYESLACLNYPAGSIRYSWRSSSDSDAEAKSLAEAKAKADAEAKVRAEAEAKSKIEADALAKAKADAIAKAKANMDAKAKKEALARAEESAKAVTPIKKKITCTKGKLVKKINGANPKCPAGYKKK